MIESFYGKKRMRDPKMATEVTKFGGGDQGLHARYLLFSNEVAMNLQNFGGSDVERGLAAARRPGSSSVGLADDEASIVVLIDRPGRRERHGANPSSSAFALLQIERVKAFSEHGSALRSIKDHAPNHE